MNNDKGKKPAHLTESEANFLLEAYEKRHSTGNSPSSARSPALPPRPPKSSSQSPAAGSASPRQIFAMADDLFPADEILSENMSSSYKNLRFGYDALRSGNVPFAIKYFSDYLEEIITNNSVISKKSTMAISRFGEFISAYQKTTAEEYYAYSLFLAYLLAYDPSPSIDLKDILNRLENSLQETAGRSQEKSTFPAKCDILCHQYKLPSIIVSKKAREGLALLMEKSSSAIENFIDSLEYLTKKNYTLSKETEDVIAQFGNFIAAYIKSTAKDYYAYSLYLIYLLKYQPDENIYQERLSALDTALSKAESLFSEDEDDDELLDKCREIRIRLNLNADSFTEDGKSVSYRSSASHDDFSNSDSYFELSEFSEDDFQVDVGEETFKAQVQAAEDFPTNPPEATPSSSTTSPVKPIEAPIATAQTKAPIQQQTASVQTDLLPQKPKRDRKVRV